MPVRADELQAVRLAETTQDKEVLARALDVLGTVQIGQRDLAVLLETEPPTTVMNQPSAPPPSTPAEFPESVQPCSVAVPSGASTAPPDAAVEETIEAIANLDRLEQLADWVLKAESWDELMAES